MDMQMKFGEIPIEKIEFDLKSRDETPKVLIGLYSGPQKWDSVLRCVSNKKEAQNEQKKHSKELKEKIVLDLGSTSFLCYEKTVNRYTICYTPCPS